MTSELPPLTDNPDNQHSPESSSLAKLALLDRELLTREEIKTVFENVPLIVLADDEPPIQRMAFNVVRMARQDRNAVVALRGNMTQCFDAAQEFNGNKLPMIFCDDGTQAREAVQIICERGIPFGIVALDELMGDPRGMTIFREFDGEIPPEMTKILQSGGTPKDIVSCLEEGIVDAHVNKFTRDALPVIARAYLRKTFLKSPESNS